ncbi:hypothetical protein HZH66_003345 [Vespula vulgaris]|uniref:Uncharacterized protein n=1 Tax=Vespula vulgaris TaxID=7454 RepID=A0A834KLA4_VESVU|nr:hypothetical protein HZH66_003345 [Vespula vulgaris]
MKSRDGENTLRREEQWLVWGRVAMRTYDAWPNILGTRRYGRTALASPTPSSSHPCRFLLFSSSRLSRSQTRPARLRSSRRNSHRASDPSARTSTPSADPIKVARRRSSHVKVVPEGDAFGIVKAWKENGEDEREKREGQFISGTINVLDIMDSGLSYGPIFLRNYSTFLGSR